ncbi:MAG TPA: CTP synthase, partial [Candidatus Saccharimonadales bacterium]|nr:CTP synthase [Candidatus Saccharimonadales bacterium]
PHVTGAIQDNIKKAGEGYDVHIVEIGGTVGDYESLSFIEAIREFGMKVGRENCLYVHVVYLPYLGASKETKTKPAQNSVREIRGLGISPDILVARSEEPAEGTVKRKLSLFCGVGEDAIALLPNAKSIYEVPLTLEDSGVAAVICQRLGLDGMSADLTTWRDMVKRAMHKHPRTVTVGVVAKYLDNQDTYMSVFEALRSAAWSHDTNVDIKWIDAEKLDEATDVSSVLDSLDGILVPGGFGSRGVEGKIKAATYALDNKKPYLGLCYGLHMGVIAAARRHGLTDANTTEVNPNTNHPVISTMDGQKGLENTGGTMRLGDYICDLEPGSLAAKVYGTAEITERHRHRYECTPKFVQDYESWGIKAVGTNPETKLVEVIEAIDHPFFLASQYHPEFKSRPTRPHPMFDGFIQSLLKKSAK